MSEEQKITEAAHLILHPTIAKESNKNKAQFLTRMGFDHDEIVKVLNKAQSMDFNNVQVTFGAF